MEKLEALERNYKHYKEIQSIQEKLEALERNWKH